MSKESDVSYALPVYTEFLPRWERVRAACKGEEEVKAIPGVLPKLNPHDRSPENEERNRSYLERAVYFNATGRTLEGLIGLAFARNPDVDLGKFDYMESDADGNGVSIYHCAQKTLGGVLQTGRHGILVDIVNDRPSIIGYPAESIINWRVRRENGKNKLTLLVLKEVVQEEKGEYGTEDIVQYREYRLIDDTVHIFVWREIEGATVLYEKPELTRPHGSKPFWDFIPFVFVGSQSNSPNIDPSPLKGLAEMNLAHFRDSADYQDSVFFCGQVQPWISGLDDEWRDWLERRGIYVGSRSPMLLPAGGAMGFEQAQPNTLVREAMENKRQMMVALGARVIEENKVTKTATQAAGDIATGTSVLGLCCANVSEAMMLALQYCGYFDSAKLFTDARFEITQDYTRQLLGPQEIDSLVKAWQAGAFAKSDLRTSFRKGGVIEPERTDQEIDQEIEAEPPTYEDDIRAEGLIE